MRQYALPKEQQARLSDADTQEANEDLPALRLVGRVIDRVDGGDCLAGHEHSGARAEDPADAIPPAGKPGACAAVTRACSNRSPVVDVGRRRHGRRQLGERGADQRIEECRGYEAPDHAGPAAIVQCQHQGAGAGAPCLLSVTVRLVLELENEGHEMEW